MSRDPDDDSVIAAAVAAQAAWIVTGDQDLLVLGSYEGIAIITPAQALQALGAALALPRVHLPTPCARTCQFAAKGIR